MDQEQLASVVGHGRTDRDLGRLIAGDAAADLFHPFDDVATGVERTIEAGLGGVLDVRRDREHLFEPLALVLALGEANARARDSGERFGPAPQRLLRNGLDHDQVPYAIVASSTSSTDPTRPV